ncbi:MFS transporter [Brevibacillus sp. SYP-B805]|uniref:MFS transporter n=1 Tax=Brevibacillus sp. SYP-B805 TaxID=1578199 RepID=UPI0013EE06B0|nr:MFS transporter [Brevibacillus sp. SYP-B805]NGQ96672.1 MFS transporter [Brevibacillus sp. SYP-B805]
MLWKNRVFVRLFAAYGLSTLGDWFDFIAVSVLLGFHWQADPMTMALLPLMYAGPGMVLGQLAGIAADRWNKLRLMVATDLLRAALTLLMTQAPDPGWLFLFILLRSCSSVFHTPAQQALTRHAVPPEQLLQAASWNGTVFQAGKVLGPLLGGTAAAYASPAVCLHANAVSFLVSALLLLSIGMVEEGRSASAGPSEKPPLREAWQEGWRVLWGSRVLLASTLFSLLAMLAIQLIDAQFTTILREKAVGHPELVGWSVSAVGAGALLAMAWLTRRKEIASYGWPLGGGILLIGLMFGWVGLLRPGAGIQWPLAAAFLGGIGTGLTFVCSQYVRQKETPAEAIGRVTGILDSLTSGVFLIAPLLGGLMITALGSAQTFVLVGAVIGAVGLGGILFQSVIWGKKQETKAANAEESA